MILCNSALIQLWNATDKYMIQVSTYKPNKFIRHPAKSAIVQCYQPFWYHTYLIREFHCFIYLGIYSRLRKCLFWKCDNVMCMCKKITRICKISAIFFWNLIYPCNFLTHIYRARKIQGYVTFHQKLHILVFSLPSIWM